MKKLLFIFLFASASFAALIASNFKSVSFSATSDWQSVGFTNPDSLDFTDYTYVLPVRTSAVMVFADGGDLEIADSTNFVVSVSGRGGTRTCSFSPILLKDGNTLVINKTLDKIFVKGSGTAVVTSIDATK